jgi:hypothetical protein
MWEDGKPFSCRLYDTGCLASPKLGSDELYLVARDVTDYLQLLLRKSGYPFHTSAEHQIVRNIKESIGRGRVDSSRGRAVGAVSIVHAGAQLRCCCGQVKYHTIWRHKLTRT